MSLRLIGSRKNARVAGVFVFALWLLYGCAAPQTRDLLQDEGLKLPARAELTDVPFFPQDEYQCGPAALATVLNAVGKKLTPEQLVPLVYVPERRGSFQVEMVAAARRYETVAVPLQPYVEDVLKEVAAGNPVLVLQNLALPIAPQWHYAVVVGYDLDQEKIILRSGQYERLETKLSTFERTWARSKYWAIVTLLPSRAPVTVTQSSYVEAAVALETTQHTAAARIAYETALKRWPRNLAALIGSGNLAYQAKDLPGAERAFRRAVQLHPDSGIALNNLAQVLYERDKLEEARSVSLQAVSKGGATLKAARETLAEIEAKLKKPRSSTGEKPASGSNSN